MQDLDSEKAGNTIYQVLQQRHMRERVQLEEQCSREIAAAKADARAQMAESRQAEREEMVAEQEKVCATLPNPWRFSLFFSIILHTSYQPNSRVVLSVKNRVFPTLIYGPRASYSDHE